MHLLLLHIYEYVGVSWIHHARGVRYRLDYMELKPYPDALRYWKVPMYTAYHHARNHYYFSVSP